MIFGARIRQAREFSLMTQKELASEIGVVQAQISRAERNEWTLPDRDLAEMAASLGFPVEYFLNPVSIEFADRPLHFRAQASMSMKVADQSRRAGEIVAEAAIRLLAELDGPICRVTSKVGLSPAAAASATRAELGLSAEAPIRGLPIVLEHAGVLMIGLPLRAERRDAYSLWIDDRTPLIALHETDAGDRQTWSTAHELGHLTLHRGDAISRDAEAAADDFAFHFLTPPAAIGREMPTRPTLGDLAMLKQRWGVSIAALIRVARRLERVDEHQYTSLYRQLSARGERLRERSHIPPIKPRGLKAMAEAAYGENLVSQLSEANRWTKEFTVAVLERHASVEELPTVPVKTPGRVTDLTEYRRGR